MLVKRFFSPRFLKGAAHFGCAGLVPLRSGTTKTGPSLRCSRQKINV